MNSACRAANAFGLALITIVGQCVGAADYGSARRSTAKLLKLSYGSIFFLRVMTFMFMDPIGGIFTLSPKAYAPAKELLKAKKMSYNVPAVLRRFASPDKGFA